jgi:hypothetical protein
LRKLNHKGISFTNQEIKRTKQGYAKPIDFSKEKADIIILAHQPGLGKTYTVLEYMKKHPDSFYFTDRHEIINEHLKDWKSISFSHWIGFNRICKNTYFKDIHKKYNLSPTVACSICTVKKCRYRWQFSARNRVFAPFDYLRTDYVMNNLPEIIFLDEKKVKVDPYYFNHNATVNWLQKIHDNSNMPKHYVDLMRQHNYFFFLYGGLKDIQQYYYNESLLNAYNANKMHDLVIIGNISPHSLHRYFKMAETYDDFLQSKYYYPYWYHAFEAINKAKTGKLKIVMMDATFNYELFRYFLESFNGEIGFSRSVSVKVFNSDVTKEDNETIVYNMRAHDRYKSWFPKSSFWSSRLDAMMKWLPYHLKKIRDIYSEENIGIVTFKIIAGSDYIKLLGLDLQYFGGLRSSNIFKDKRVIIVIGTFFEKKEDIFDLIEKLFDEHDRGMILEEFENEKIMSKLLKDVGIISKTSSKEPTLYDKVLKIKKRRRFTDVKDWVYDNKWYLEGYKVPKRIFAQDHEDMIKYVIYPVELIQRSIWDDEMYQAFHRNRGLLNERIIFAYCWFPPKILREFKVENVKNEKEEEEKFWNKLEKQEEKRKLMESFIKDMDELVKKNRVSLKDIKEVISNPKKRLGIITELAKKYKMYNKSDRDTIKQLLLHYYKIKNLV